MRPRFHASQGQIRSAAGARRRPAGRMLITSALALTSSVGACLVHPGAAQGANIRPDFCVANGPVRALLLSGNTLYVGGEFTQLGPPMPRLGRW